MENIKLTFLGTSNAIPTKQRNHPSILASFKDENILVDCGEGTQRQLRIAGISPTKITKILITHWHGDHILGLPGLFQTLAMSNYQKTLHLYGPKGTIHYMRVIESLLNKFKIKIEVKEIENSILFENKEYYIETKSMLHDSPCNAYSIILKDKIRINKTKLKKLKLPNSPLLRQLQEGKDVKINNKLIKAKSLTYKEKGKKASFILDTRMNNNTIEISKNSDLLVCESTFSKQEQELAKEYKHLTSTQAAEIAKKSKSKKLILTHISQRYEFNPKPLLNDAKRIFKNTFLVKDLDSIEI